MIEGKTLKIIFFTYFNILEKKKTIFWHFWQKITCLMISREGLVIFPKLWTQLIEIHFYFYNTTATGTEAARSRVATATETGTAHFCTGCSPGKGLSCAAPFLLQSRHGPAAAIGMEKN